MARLPGPKSAGCAGPAGGIYLGLEFLVTFGAMPKVTKAHDGQINIY